MNHIPLRRLYPFIKGLWRVKVRIIKIHEKRNWNNDRGSGCLLNFDLIDGEGTELQATIFSDHIDRYEHQLRLNAVYLISNALVKPAKEHKGNQIDISIVFDKGTIL